MKTLQLAILVGSGITIATIFSISYFFQSNVLSGTTESPGAVNLDLSNSNSSTECEIKFKPKEFQSGTFPNGTSYTINYIPVFLIKPNSTGKLCINYWSIDKSFNYSGKTLPGTSESYNSAISSITMTTYPENISIDSLTNKTIVHTITTYKDTKGFFKISPMFYNCIGLPLAVGYNSTHSFDNDFPWLWDTPPCAFNGILSQITGISGIDVAYIKKEYH